MPQSDVACLTDIAGPFYDSSRPFRNWSSLPFLQFDQPHPPYVHQTQLAQGVERAQAYLHRVAEQGYTGVVIDNMAHLVGFEQAPVAIYPANSPYRHRAARYRDAFGHLFETAAHLGMEVFVTSDMQWATPPVRHYAGTLSASNPRLADINRWALEELFTTMPRVRGIVVRVGEAGGAHNQNNDYTGHMLYTDVASLQHLIDTLLPVCEHHNRLLIVRTWSIGIGELGNIMWSPERYREVFHRYRSPHLVVSLKHGPSDFYRCLPPNPTAGLPGPQQIIELQNRREYELFGMVPSSVVPLHQQVIQREQATSRQFAGVWAWNSTGGWGGGRAALGTDGWSFWTELSSAVTAALVQHPDMDADEFVHRWCVTRLGEPFGTAVAALYTESGTLFEQGWYSGKLVNGKAALGNTYLPSLLWVWWMRPTASSLVWSYLASAVGDYRQICEQSQHACDRLAWHVENLEAHAPQGCPQAATLVESTRYLHDCITVAHAIRSLMFRAFDAAWRDQHTRWVHLATQVAPVQATLQHHRNTWGTNDNLPPLELDEVETFLATLQRRPGVLWYQARASCLLVKQLRDTPAPGRPVQVMGMIAATLLLLSLFSRRPRVVGVAGVAASVFLASPLRQRTLRTLVPMINRRLGLLPSIFFETGPSFTEWLA